MANLAKDKVNKNTPTEGTKPVAKRKQLTPAERVAKAEKDLAELKAKAEAKETKAKDAAKAERTKLTTKISELQTKVDALTKVIGDDVVEPRTEDTES